MKWDIAIPKIFRLTQEERTANWEKNPPKAVTLVDPARLLDPETEKFRAEFEAEKKRKTTRRIQEMLVKKQLVKTEQDTQGKVWNQKYCRWDVDPAAPPQENEMPKLVITPYTADGKALERGKTSINADASPEEIDAKIQSAAKRAGKQTAHVNVTDNEGFLHTSWNVPGTPAPAVDTAIATPTTESAVPATKKTKSPKSPKKSATNGRVKKVGVIATILEMLNRASGTTVEEALDRLKTKFPERERDSMRTTCKIQLARHCKSKDKSETRGLIYYATK